MPYRIAWHACWPSSPLIGGLCSAAIHLLRHHSCCLGSHYLPHFHFPTHPTHTPHTPSLLLPTSCPKLPHPARAHRYLHNLHMGLAVRALGLPTTSLVQGVFVFSCHDILCRAYAAGAGEGRLDSVARAAWYGEDGSVLSEDIARI